MSKMAIINKILGFGLLLGGVALIIWGVQASFGIFLHNQSPPEIFEVEINGVEQEAVNQEEDVLVDPIDAIIQDLMADMVPTGAVQKMLNLMIWGLFMAILFIGGSKLATIGVQLISIKDGKK